jgi:osmotically-inducible protein OsmY
MKERTTHTGSLRAAAVLLVGPLLICGCHQQRAAAAMVPDGTITSRVKAALREDPRVVDTGITATADDGIVKLTGTVYNLAEKRYADKEAEKIDGVRGVINEIAAKPAYRSDTDIARDIRWRLNNDATIRPHDCDASVINGEATLTGDVSSWAERQEAELVAMEVPGVKKVRDELQIEYPSYRSDDAIQRDVSSALQRDVYVTSLPITATVKDGVVTLEGRVGSAYERERAENDARWVRNVKSVKNNLSVQAWENEGVRKAAPHPSDSKLKTTVTDELYEDFRIRDPFEVTVDAKYGGVTLRGDVPTYDQKELAEEDARDVVGVAWVTNQLTVNTESRTDEAIRDDMQAEINSDYLLKDKPIEFHVQKGVVTLSGQVTTWYQKSHAKELASRVLGVKDVVNDITVTWTSQYTDEALQDRIKDHLVANAETRFVADLIKVHVRNGEARLTGDVNSWAERREAGRVALMTDGVKVLDNRLTVAGVNYPWDEWHYPGESGHHSSFDEYDLHARLP